MKEDSSVGRALGSVARAVHPPCTTIGETLSLMIQMEVSMQAAPEVQQVAGDVNTWNKTLFLQTEIVYRADYN